MKRWNKRRAWIALALVAAFLVLCGFSASQTRVYDYDGLYDESQRERLEQLLYETSAQLKCELAIVTVSDYDGKSSMEFADDFYDQQELGREFDETGFLLLINMSERELYISNGGEAPRYFTDSMIDEMVSEIGSRLADYDYVAAAEWFVDYVDENMWQESESEDASFPWWAQLLVAMLISGVIVGCMTIRQGMKMTVGGADYMKNHKPDVLSHSDVFLRTTTVKHVIEKDSSSGSGGGSTHTSSSGHTHGGGGGKF